MSKNRYTAPASTAGSAAPTAASTATAASSQGPSSGEDMFVEIYKAAEAKKDYLKYLVKAEA